MNNTEVNNYYGTEQTETVESSPSFNRSVEFDFDGVRVILELERNVLSTPRRLDPALIVFEW